MRAIVVAVLAAYAAAADPPSETSKLREARKEYKTQMQYQGQYPDEAAELKREYEKDVARIRAEYASKGLPPSLMLVGESTKSERVAALTASTQKVITKMYGVRDEAKPRLEAMLPGAEKKLDSEPDKAQAAVQEQRTKLESDFEAKLKDVEQDPTSLSASQNLTQLTGQLDGLDAQQIRTLRAGLDEAARPTMEVIDRYKHNASVLQHRARRTLDPLYSMGDDAEDHADDLGDKTGDAEDAILAVADHAERELRHYKDGILRHAEDALKDKARQRGALARRAESPAEMNLVAVQAYSAAAPADDKLTLAFIGTAGASAVVSAAVAFGTVHLRAKKMLREPLLPA